MTETEIARLAALLMRSRETIATLAKERDEARAKALEDAATVADLYRGQIDDAWLIADNIRALDTDPECEFALKIRALATKTN